jgi:hypothetical protein
MRSFVVTKALETSLFIIKNLDIGALRVVKG